MLTLYSGKFYSGTPIAESKPISPMDCSMFLFLIKKLKEFILQV